MSVQLWKSMLIRYNVHTICCLSLYFIENRHNSFALVRGSTQTGYARL